MISRLLRWIIDAWLSITGKTVAYTDHSWLEGPIGDHDHIGDQYYEEVATKDGLQVLRNKNGGLIEDFADVLPVADPNRLLLNTRIKDFYEHTATYKLEVWSEWYAPVSFFARILISSLSTKMNQLNIPLKSLETSHGMSNEVIHLLGNNGAIRYACWLRKSILTDKVVYAGFYSGITINGQPFVRVVFPLPKGNVTVVLRVETLPDGSVQLISDGKKFGEPGYYRVIQHKKGAVKLRHIPIHERIHVFEDRFGVLRTDHVFRFWGYKFLHLHYKIMER